MLAPIRVLALIEAASVTGPAKNLIAFAKWAAHRQDGRRIETSIVTIQRTGAPDDNAFISAVNAAGIPLIVLEERRRLDLTPVRQLKSLLGQLRPHVLQSHHVKSHLFIRLMGVEQRYPWVAFNHGYTATDLKDALYNQFDRWTLRGATRVVTVCKPFARTLVERGVRPERIVIQHNSVPAFCPPGEEAVMLLRERFRLQDDQIILTVGRLSREKGHADLLKAAALEKNRLLGWRLVFVGDGPERDSLGRLASELKISDRVVFAGQQTDIRPYYALASIVAVPSHSEGSPNVVLEAMAAGVPILATEVGGVPEILTHGETGFIVQARRPASIGTGLVALVEQEDLRQALRQRALSVVQEHYSPEARHHTLSRLYEEIVGEIGEDPVSSE